MTIDNKKVFGAGYHAGVKASGGIGAKGSCQFPTATEMMLCWNPGTTEVKLIRWPDTERRSRDFCMSTLACNTFMHKLTFEQRKTVVFIEAMHLIVLCRCDPNAVHRALLGLAEYRDGCAYEMLRNF